MPMDLGPLVAPDHTVLVLQECQRGVIGDLSMLPALATAARATVIPSLARLVPAARAGGVRVVHCLATPRFDGFGRNTNARLFAALGKSRQAIASGAGEPIPEVAPEPADVVLTRMQGLSPFAHSELDPILRNAGVRTIVAAGASVNVALLNLAFDAVNAGYQVVMPRDAIAGVPEEYVDAVVEHTLRAIATITTTDDLLAHWDARA
jgi:nicotinamidase-related amidase